MINPVHEKFMRCAKYLLNQLWKKKTIANPLHCVLNVLFSTVLLFILKRMHNTQTNSIDFIVCFRVFNSSSILRAAGGISNFFFIVKMLLKCEFYVHCYLVLFFFHCGNHRGMKPTFFSPKFNKTKIREKVIWIRNSTQWNNDKLEAE